MTFSWIDDAADVLPSEILETNDDDGSDKSDSNTNMSYDGLNDSALPSSDQKQQLLSDIQKLKDNCKSEDLEKLKTKCERLVRDCIAGLLIQLSDTDFKSMEGWF